MNVQCALVLILICLYYMFLLAAEYIDSVETVLIYAGVSFQCLLVINLKSVHDWTI